MIRSNLLYWGGGAFDVTKTITTSGHASMYDHLQVI